MALDIYWTKRADQKFDNILEYPSLEWGDNVTALFVRKVYSFLDVLSEFPKIGTLENPEKGIRGFTIIKQVNIFYKISKDKIILLDFFDNRQNPGKKRL